MLRKFASLFLAGTLSFSVLAQHRAPLNPAENKKTDALIEHILAKRKQALELMKAQGQTPKIQLDEDKIAEAQMILPDGLVGYFTTTSNVNTAKTISTDKAWPGGSLGLNLTGAGETPRVWDESLTRTSHQEFGSRLVHGDGAATLSRHATHVSGTIMASGVSANAKGMAYAANCRSFDWNSDVAEMQTEAANGMILSNHSYGFLAGWSYSSSNTAWFWYGRQQDFKDWKFGFYDDYAQAYDQIQRNYPYYTIVKSAGNNRSSGSSTGPGPGNPYFVRDNSNNWVESTEPRDPNTGYDGLSTFSTAKNLLSVAAVNPIAAGYSQPSDVVMSTFSSWGPTDDGRIKPDISACGVSVFSTSHTADDAYATLSGTSMAAPSVTGSLTLIQQHHKNLFNEYLLSHTLKAIVLHTADEAGPNDGPDYQFGWGLMNTAKCIEVISNSGQKHALLSRTLNNNGTYTIRVRALGNEPLKASIAWTDPAAVPLPVAVDNPTKRLINDLDLRVTDLFTNTATLPWKLNPASPASAATKGDNDLDNVEVVFVANPVAGREYQITVSHKGTLSGGSQGFGLVVSGIQPTAVYLGGTNNFSDANNWMYKSPPTGSFNAYIPAGTINQTSNVSFKDLTIATGATYNLADGVTLGIGGDLVNRGTLSGLGATLNFNGSAYQITEGNFNIGTLIADNPIGLSLSDNVNIYKLLDLRQGEFNTVGANVTLVSNATHRALMGPVGNDAFVEGDLKIEQYIANPTPAWHFISSTVDGLNLGHMNTQLGLMGIPGTAAGNPTIYAYDNSNPSNAGWVSPSGLSTSLNPNSSMRVFLRNSFFDAGRKFSQTGPPYVGQQIIELSYCTNNCAEWTGQTGANGWNLIGNPYAAPVDWHAVGKNNVAQTIYYFCKTGYATYSAATQIGVNGGTRYIAPAQGFFALSTAGSSSVVFNESNKVIAQNPSFLREEEVPNVLRFTAERGSASDEVAVVFRSDANRTLQNNGLNSRKMHNSGALNLNILHPEGGRFAIQARPIITEADTIELLVSGLANAQLNLTMRGLNTFSSATEVLALVSGQWQRVQEGDALTVNTNSAGQATIKVVVGPQVAAGFKGLNHSKFNLFPIPATDKVTLRGELIQQGGKISVSNLAGVEVLNQVIGSGQNSHDLGLKAVPKGLYLLNFSTTSGEQWSHKLIVE